MIMKKEKCWDLLHHYVYMHRGIPTFYDGTDAYVTRKENDQYVYRTVARVKQEKIHYIYPNAATVAIFKRVSDINTYKRILARKRWSRRCANRLVAPHPRTCGAYVEQ